MSEVGARSACGIYAFYHGSRERYLYVGSSQNLRKRTYEHRRLLRRGSHFNKHLQNAWNKYGEADIFIALVEECTPDRLIEREQHWADTLSPACNVGQFVDSPTRGRTMPAEFRAKISANKKGNKYWLGKKHTPETLSRLSASHQGPRPGRRGKTGRPSWNKGKTGVYSAETLEKMSVAKKGKKTGRSWNKGKPAWNRGKPQNPETLAKLTAIRNTEQYKAKLRAAALARYERERARKQGLSGG